MYPAYIFLKQSAGTGNKLRTNLSGDYITGENKYHVTRPATFH